jgi:geranylgeranyl diphosphate synthase type II
MPMSTDSFQNHLAELRATIESAMADRLSDVMWPRSLKEVVEYSLLAGGKRLRPVLVLLAADFCGGRQGDAVPAACAIEMLHTYSLIHDDLPSMDDDDFRRGRPTSHKMFGEALAILAGDCLLTLAFETVAKCLLPGSIRAELAAVLATAAGGGGMVGGQILDLEAEKGGLIPIGSNLSAGDPVDQLTRIHTMKTGALIAASLELGAICAEADESTRGCLRQYGFEIGLAFQIADDLLDVTGDKARLGKTTGRDADLGKLTYPALLGMEASRDRAVELVEQACRRLSPFGEKSVRLTELARFIVERDH